MFGLNEKLARYSFTKNLLTLFNCGSGTLKAVGAVFIVLPPADKRGYVLLIQGLFYIQRRHMEEMPMVPSV